MCTVYVGGLSNTAVLADSVFALCVQVHWFVNMFVSVCLQVYFRVFVYLCLFSYG